MKIPKQTQKERRAKELETKILQGELPFQSDLYFEQANPILRSNLFQVSTPKGFSGYDDWTSLFNIGGGSIKYMGPALTVDHEEVWGMLLTWARGRSLTKAVPVLRSELLRAIDLSNGGKNYARLGKILNDLSLGKVLISSRPALEKIYKILTSDDIEKLPDGEFFRSFIKNRYGESLKLIAEALANKNLGDGEVSIEMKFIEKRTRTRLSGKEAILLDPITCLFFDGVNTTLVPYEIRKKLDGYGRKLISVIASHRDGVYNISLENLYYIGYSSNFLKQIRDFKSKLKKRLESYESLNYIEPGWDIYQNEYNIWMVRGLKAGQAIKIRRKTNLTDPPREMLDKEFAELEQEGLDIDIFSQGDLLSSN